MAPGGVKSLLMRTTVSDIDRFFSEFSWFHQTVCNFVEASIIVDGNGRLIEINKQYKEYAERLI